MKLKNLAEFLRLEELLPLIEEKRVNKKGIEI